MPERRVKVWVQAFQDRDNLVLQWLDPDTGKRKSKSAGTKDPKEAEAKRVDLEADLNNNRHQEVSRMSWERFRELFEEEYVAGLRPKTQTLYASILDLFEELAHPKRLQGISERTLSTFTAAMRQRRTYGRIGMMPSTIRRNLQYLHTALGWAVKQKLLPEVPAFPNVKVPRKKPQPIPAESFERLLAKAPDQQTRVFLLCGWLAGLRLAEAEALEREPSTEAPYLDLARNRIVLPAEFAKSVEDQWVPLDPILRQALEELPPQDQGQRVFRFTSQRGGLLTTNGISERIIRLARKAGVRLTMHSLRKGFGCRYAGKVPAQVLQRLMRHGDIKTTMTYYANIDAAVEEAVLGTQCNTSRNGEPAATQHAAEPTPRV